MSSICFDNRNELFGTGLRGETHQKKKKMCLRMNSSLTQIISCLLKVGK